jgi:hypothetical protein
MVTMAGAFRALDVTAIAYSEPHETGFEEEGKEEG